MTKPYVQWYLLKAALDKHDREILFNAGEIWWAHIGANIGHEQDGKGKDFERPVLVLKKFNRHLFLGVPLSSQQKTGPYYQTLEYSGFSSTAIISQLRTYSSKRLVNRIGEVRIAQLQTIRENVSNMIL